MTDRSTPLIRLLAIASALLATCAQATPTDELAARAVTEAKMMLAGRPRDVALREISRNLRHVDRSRAMDAARAMSDDSELRSFGPGPDQLTQQVIAWHQGQADKSDQCERLILGLETSKNAKPDLDQRIRECFFMDAPPGIVPPPVPPFHLIIAASEALTAGRTKAELLYMATWDSVPRRPPGGAQDAVQRLRALLPRLEPELQKEAAGWLESTAVDQIERRPDAAIARVRQAFQRPANPTASLADEPATQAQAQGLIADFLRAEDINRAVEVTGLLAPSQDCSMVDDGLTGVTEWVLPLQQDEAVVGAYFDRLQATGIWSRLCPRGLSNELAAGVWLKAGREVKALEAASASGNPILLARTRATVAERRLEHGDTAGANDVILSAAATPPPLDRGNEFERAAAAASRIRLIHQLIQVGETATAERLAAAYPGPGWRGFAYSVIAATIGRDRAGATWAGPFLDLQEVPAGS